MTPSSHSVKRIWRSVLGSICRPTGDLEHGNLDSVDHRCCWRSSGTYGATETPDRTLDGLWSDLCSVPFWLLLILVALAALSVITQQDIPAPSPVFLGYAWAGGLLQLFGNALLLHLLGLSTFTVGMTYTKTEVIQTVAVSFVVLGERFWLYNAIGCF